MRSLLYKKVAVPERLYISIKTLCTIALLMLPVFLYVFAYSSGDCDDKAVHYYSAGYVFCSDETKESLHNALDEKVSALDEYSSNRYYFRLWESPTTYPVTNLFIKAITHVSDLHYAHTVAIGLFFTMLLGYVFVIYGNYKAGLSFFQQGLLYTVLIFLGLSIGPHGMVAFLTYVPRAIAALFVVPILIFLSKKQPKAAVLFCIAPFFFHTSLGVLMVGFIAAAYSLYFLQDKYSFIRFNIETLKPALLVIIYICCTAAAFVIFFAISQTGFGEELNVRYNWFDSLPMRILGITQPAVAYLCILLISLRERTKPITLIRNLATGLVIAAVVTTIIVISVYHVRLAIMRQALPLLNDSCINLSQFSSINAVDLSNESRTFYTIGEYIFQRE